MQWVVISSGICKHHTSGNYQQFAGFTWQQLTPLRLNYVPSLPRAVFDGERKGRDPLFKPPRQASVTCHFCSKAISGDSLRQGGRGMLSHVIIT